MLRPFRAGRSALVGWVALLLSCALLLVYLPGSPAALIWPYEWFILLGWGLLGLIFWVWARREQRDNITDGG
jgi:hypothetical protein